MRVLNFFGGPGSGKSTTRAKLFGLMKSAGWRVDEAPEFAKDLTYERSWDLLGNQLFVTAGQEQRLNRLNGQVDWCLSDSPLTLALIYGQGRFDSKWYHDFVWGLFDHYDNVNVFISRAKPYEAYGRTQTEDEARQIDVKLREIMGKRIHLEVPGDRQAHKTIFAYLEGLRADAAQS